MIHAQASTTARLTQLLRRDAANDMRSSSVSLAPLRLVVTPSSLRAPAATRAHCVGHQGGASNTFFLAFHTALLWKAARGALAGARIRTTALAIPMMMGDRAANRAARRASIARYTDLARQSMLLSSKRHRGTRVVDGASRTLPVRDLFR